MNCTMLVPFLKESNPGDGLNENYRRAASASPVDKNLRTKATPLASASFARTYRYHGIRRTSSAKKTNMGGNMGTGKRFPKGFYISGATSDWQFEGGFCGGGRGLLSVDFATSRQRYTYKSLTCWDDSNKLSQGSWEGNEMSPAAYLALRLLAFGRRTRRGTAPNALHEGHSARGGVASPTIRCAMR